MSHAPVPAVVLFVRDVPRMAEFYREVGGMSVLEADADHVVLEAAGIQLVVHALRDAPAPDPGGVVPREDSYFKFCLPVPSLTAARAVAARYGGALKPGDAEWEARDFRACDGHDPEGNIIQLREPG